ncbi:phosphohistidine phosphatase [Alcanivorax hongdengensis A-11-3]|uniref:Phosphohistidine phosphatase n=1 Tax=Alcanivorax hongdengensis A-11-3 TaxID=1177179 RepID=L0WG83_9GAMM|nr:phosphohistidine phosphatase SixA [Alcanivorax hongdengensis]EKF74830.1 phosphohistidine phosphatase [Alcanivorax hongdengensis A-11-3]
MKLYLCRHGQAVSQAATDALRPLTETGEAAVLAHWQALQAAGIPVNRIIASPYLRAQQTASCIQRVYRSLDIITCEALVPESAPPAVFDWLQGESLPNGTVLVSHMPLVALLTAQWTGSGQRCGFNVGTVACLDVEVCVADGARLLWMSSPGESLPFR